MARAKPEATRVETEAASSRVEAERAKAVKAETGAAKAKLMAKLRLESEMLVMLRPFKSLGQDVRGVDCRADL